LKAILENRGTRSDTLGVTGQGGVGVRILHLTEKTKFSRLPTERRPGSGP
jgi:hypothetical protein